MAAVSHRNPGTCAAPNSVLATAFTRCKRGRAASRAGGSSGTRFSIDGKTGYFAGTNSYWIGFLTNNQDVDTTLDHIASSGLKILRVWGFNDVNSRSSPGTVWYQLLSSSGSEINTGPDGLQRLDYVVESAEKRGVKLIINFVNNWDDYGGMNAYVKAFGGTKEGWYTNAQAQAQYKKYIEAVVSRYAQSDAVFAWELANEPRLDPDHMITLGDEGFGLPGDGTYPYQYSEGVDFAKNLKIKDLDFGTFHMYPDAWGVPYSFGENWIKSHADACKAANKPCLLEEYGARASCDIQKHWQQTALSLAADGVSGDLFWQWDDQLSTGLSPNDGNTVYYGSSLAQCLVIDHVKAINESEATI
ncbi:hypothetical protein VTH82DRAFT_4776 [Thermothelomyces myriococcoides]